MVLKEPNGHEISKFISGLEKLCITMFLTLCITLCITLCFTVYIVLYCALYRMQWSWKKSIDEWSWKNPLVLKGVNWKNVLEKIQCLERIHMINGLETTQWSWSQIINGLERNQLSWKCSPVNGLERCQMINGLEKKQIVSKEFTW